MESSSQDRNLPASEQKLRRARADGQVPRSRDLSHLAVLGAGAVTIAVLARPVFERLQQVVGRQLTFNHAAIAHPEDMLIRIQEMVGLGLALSLGFALITIAAAILSTLATGGWVTTLKPLMPDLSRLNPLTGIKGLFSKKKLAEVAKLAFIATMLIVVGWLFLSRNMEALSMLVLQPSAAALPDFGYWLATGIGLLLLVLLLVAVVDVPLQVFLHKSELKMSLQEVKDEHKNTEGNPHVKSKRRERQREIAQRGSVSAVPKADFVVMNPTHFAVAVQYDDKTMSAPRVIAKGADLLAMKIRDVAKAHTIPVLQSPRLARALYANAELDQPIPAALYTAVAQVLAYVYRLKASLRGEGPAPGEPPEPTVPPELDPQSRPARA